jgi:hypothetical protein
VVWSTWSPPRLHLGCSLPWPPPGQCGGGAIDRDQLANRMTGALKIDDSAALAAIAELTTAQLLEALPGQGSRVGLTGVGQARNRQICTAIDEITARL